MQDRLDRENNRETVAASAATVAIAAATTSTSAKTVAAAATAVATTTSTAPEVPVQAATTTQLPRTRRNKRAIVSKTSGNVVGEVHNTRNVKYRLPYIKHLSHILQGTCTPPPPRWLPNVKI